MTKQKFLLKRVSPKYIYIRNTRYEIRNTIYEVAFPKGYQRPKTNEQLAREFCGKFGATPEVVFAEADRLTDTRKRDQARDQIIRERIRWLRSTAAKKKEFERMAEGKKTREDIESSLRALALPVRNAAEALAMTLVEDEAGRRAFENILAETAQGPEAGNGLPEAGSHIRAFQSEAIDIARTLGWIRHQLENELKMLDYQK